MNIRHLFAAGTRRLDGIRHKKYPSEDICQSADEIEQCCNIRDILLIGGLALHVVHRLEPKYTAATDDNDKVTTISKFRGLSDKYDLLSDYVDR